MENRKAEKRREEDENGIIVAGPEAHARERAGSDPAHPKLPEKDRPAAKPDTRS